jgi:hypothetical protein
MRCYPYGMKIFISMMVVGAVILIGAQTLWPEYPQNTGIFPQAVSCNQESKPRDATDPHWQPPLRVEVEPVRDPGRVREYRVFGCTAYYYFAHFR